MEYGMSTEALITLLYQRNAPIRALIFFTSSATLGTFNMVLSCSIQEREMLKQYFETHPGRIGTSDIEIDDTIWKDLPFHLVEKCLGHLPVLTIASKLREVSRTWRDFPGTSPFMALHNHGKNVDSCFGFLMHGTNILTRQCETMAFDHNTLKWQLAPSLQLEGPHRTCQVESVSEGILCLSPYPTFQNFIVWNPLLSESCKQTIPRVSQEYWSVNLVVNKPNASFKILAFTSYFRECYTYSSSRSSWIPPTGKGPNIYEGLFFPKYREGGHITVSYKNSLYVAVGSLINDIHQVGDLCYDVNRNVWKTAVMFPLWPKIMKLYGYCFTRSLFVISDMMYKVVEYVGGVHLIGNARPCPTVQILARSVAPGNNADKWRVIATTVLPRKDWEMKWFGTWYGCILEGHEKPTICGLFKSEPYLFLMMYSVSSCTWATVCVTDEATSDFDGSQDPIGIMVHIRRSWGCQWTANQRKWLSMKMVPHYEPSWICPAGLCECRHKSVSSSTGLKT